MKTKILALTIAPISWAMLAGSAQAAILLQDDFESNALGATPAGWTLVGLGGALTTFTVESDSQSLIGNVGDDRGMHLDNDPGVTFDRMERGFAAQTGTFYVQFDYRAFNLAELHNIQLGDGAFGNSTPGRGPNLSMSTTSGVTGGTWYRFTLEIDVAANDYDLRLQSLADTSVDTTTTDIAFNNPQTELDSIRFWFNTGNNGVGEYALDNVLVTDDAGDLNFTVIPEPSTLAMGVVGLFGIWKRRRRHA